MRQLFALAALTLLVGCNRMQSEPRPTATPDTWDQFNQADGTADATPTPNYDEREGDRYFYVSEVSDDDKKKGIAVGRVTEYEYIGTINGVVTLQQVTESGVPLSRIECKTECRVMKLTLGASVSRMPYNPASVVGSAMQDAINGFLEPVKATKTTVETTLLTLPARFTGSWNVDLDACGTGNNDSAMTITPGVIQFYESNVTIENVSMSGRTATVNGKLASDEGGSENSTIKMTLGADGNSLKIGDVTRWRCPSA